MLLPSKVLPLSSSTHVLLQLLGVGFVSPWDKTFGCAKLSAELLSLTGLT